MKKTLRNICIATALAPFLSHCASQDEVKRLQYQLHIVNKRLEEMKATTVGDIQKRQAASSSQIDHLEREILSLKGQLEETSHQNLSLREQNKNLELNIGEIAKEEAARREEALKKIEDEQMAKEARIAELTEKLKLQEENLQAIQDARVREAERRARQAKLKAEAAKARALAANSSLKGGQGGIIHITRDKSKKVFSSAQSTPKVVQSQSPSPSQPQTPQPQKAQSSQKTVKKAAARPAASTAPAEKAGTPLLAAQKLYDQKLYDKAYSSFEKVASSNPGSDTAVTASYMMGECLFEKKEYDKAILQYQKIISQHSNHPKAATSTLKQAMAFELLADNETAKMIYKKIVTHYGSSPEAAVAKQKLSNL